jgi:hypothetical protein
VSARASRIAVVGAALAAAALLAVGAATTDAADGVRACDGHDHAVGHDAPAQKRGRFEQLPDVELSPKVETKLNALADAFQRRSGRSFVVTSGTRGPEDQADVFVAKLEAGDDVLKLYRDKNAVLELKRLYDLGRAASRPRALLVAQIAAAIKAQMRRGVFISAHLRAGAADVRSTTMTGADRRHFVDAAREVGGVSILVETIPPHFHLQLD